MDRRKLLIGAGAVAAAAGAGAAISLRGMGSQVEYDAAAEASRAALGDDPGLGEIVRYATLAPNGHNTQPWRFRIAPDRIEVLPDFARRTPVVDPDDHHLFISLGCAAENAALASAAAGRPAEVAFEPSGDGAVVCALGNGAAEASELFQAIPARQSTRAEYDGRPLAAGELELLAAAAAEPGVQVALVTDRGAMGRIGELIVEGNTRQIGDPAFVAELQDWIRFNPAEALVRRDGLFAGASGNPSLPGWLSGPMFRMVLRAGPENDKINRQVASSAGIAVFLTDTDDPDHWSRVGQSYQRFALQATALGIRTAHLNQPVEVTALRGDLAEAAGAAGAHPFLVIRFGRGPLMPYSLRRPVAAVLA